MRTGGLSSLRVLLHAVNQYRGVRPVEPYSRISFTGSPMEFRATFSIARDYYIDYHAVPPALCAEHGVLVKAVVAHNVSGSTPTLLPLLDCVADMQVEYGLDKQCGREPWKHGRPTSPAG